MTVSLSVINLLITLGVVIMITYPVRFVGREVQIHLMESFDTLPSGFQPIACDIETSGTTYGVDVIRTVQIADTRQAFVYRWIPDINLTNLWAHSANAFDEIFLTLAGKPTAFRCSMLLSRLVDPVGVVVYADGKKIYKHALTNMIQKHLDSTYDSDKALKARFKETKTNYATIPTDDEIYVIYGGLDALAVALLVQKLSPRVTPKISELLRYEHSLREPVKGISIRGVASDPEKIAEARKLLTEEAEQAEVPILAMGLPATTAKQIDKQQWVDFFGRLELPRTEKGAVSFDKRKMTRCITTLRPEDPRRIAWKNMVNLRKSQGHLKLYVDKFTPIIRPSMNLAGTLSMRITASQPNLQQLPSKGPVRPCLTAGDGYVLLSADLAQVEFRMSAALSGDETLKRVIEQPDMYATISSAIYGYPIVKGMPERDASKIAILALGYGAGLDKLAMILDLTLDEAQVWKGRYVGLFPQFAQWSHDVSQLDSIELPNGLVIPVDTNRNYANGNYIIQSMSRYLHSDGILRLTDRGLSDNLWMTAHDELIIRVPESDAEDAGRLLQSCVSTSFNDLPFPSELSEPMRNWVK